MTRFSWLFSLLPMRLDMLLRLSGSDKEQPGRHRYGRTYHRLFRPLKYRRIRLPEIGIGGYDRMAGGESLASWSCFFPFADVNGADIVDKTNLRRGRIRIHMVDQSSELDLRRLAADCGPFDIVIDDGSHINAHQILTFQQLFRHVKHGGIYVIEDVQTSYWQGEYGGTPVNSPNFDQTCVGYFCELAKYINYPEFRALGGVDASLLAFVRELSSIEFQHNLIILRKDLTPRYSYGGVVNTDSAAAG